MAIDWGGGGRNNQKHELKLTVSKMIFWPSVRLAVSIMTEADGVFSGTETIAADWLRVPQATDAILPALQYL